MAAVSPLESRRFLDINPRLINQIAGLHPKQELSAAEIIDLIKQITPPILNRERAGIQAIEAKIIDDDATSIQQLITREGYKQPSIYAVYTVGFKPPENSREIGQYGISPFDGFPSPAIKGHTGKVHIVPIGNEGETMLIFAGRGHPNEWTGERWGNIVVAHPLRVVKELIRRQRVGQGINPAVLLSYVTGVTQGYKMKPGDIGIILDDTTLDNILHPSFGPVDILDPLIGEHFQPKAGRSSDVLLAKLLRQTAQQNGVKTFPVAVCGTPGLAEYQSFGEVPIFRRAFEEAKRDRGLSSIAKSVYGFWGPSLMAPLWDMGITFEEATMRQLRKGERPFSVLAITLPTDLVGGIQSLTINHDLVVESALATAPRNSALMIDLAEGILKSPILTHTDRTDFSVRREFARYQIMG